MVGRFLIEKWTNLLSSTGARPWLEADRGCSSLWETIFTTSKFLPHLCPVVKSTRLTRWPLWYWATGLPPSLAPPTWNKGAPAKVNFLTNLLHKLPCLILHVPISVSEQGTVRILDGTRLMLFNSRTQVAKTNWPLFNDLKSLQRLSARVLHIVDQAGQRGKPAFCHYQSGLGNVDSVKYQLACEPSSTGISSAHEGQDSQNPSFPVKHFYFSDALNHHSNCISHVSQSQGKSSEKR